MEYENLYQDGLSPQAPPSAPAAKSGGRGRRIAASVAASVVLLGTGAAMGVALTGGASAATGSSAAAKTPAAKVRAAGPCRKLAATLKADGHPAAARRVEALCRSGLLRIAARGLYGDVTVKAKGGGTRTVAFERGTVQSVSGSAVTVRAVNGTTWTWHIAADTVVREAGAKVAASKLADGAQVLVVGQVTAGADDARLIRIRAAG
jgi:hypothetical protein